MLIGYGGRNWIHKNDLLALQTATTISLEEVDDEDFALAGLQSLGGGDARKRDRLETQLEDVWTHLEYRAGAMHSYYPFEVEGDKLRMLNGFNIKHRAYRLLLACSRLRSFGKKGVPQRWAKSFAKICRLAMCGLLPEHATVRIFDANSDDRRDYYDTDLRKALPKLGRDLRVIKIDEDECNKASAQGDAGIDLVGIIDFGDGAVGNFAIIGQCGAQETGWPSKTLEATSVRFRNYFSVPFDWPSVMFTPVCYREADGQWVDNQNACGVLLVDRFRILSMLQKTDSWDLLDRAEWLIKFEIELRESKYET